MQHGIAIQRFKNILVQQQHFLVDSPETPLSGTYASGMNIFKKVAFAFYINYVAIKFLNPKADEKPNSHAI